MFNYVKSEGTFSTVSGLQVGGKVVYSSVTQNKEQAENAEALGMIILAAGTAAACYAGNQIFKGAKALWKKF